MTGIALSASHFQPLFPSWKRFLKISHGHFTVKKKKSFVKAKGIKMCVYVCVIC